MSDTRSNHSTDTRSDHIAKAVALMQQQRFEEALALCKAHIAQQPTGLQGHFYGAVCLRYLARFDEAHTQLQQLLAQHTQYGKAHQELGNLYRDQQQFELALHAYQHAVNLNPMLAAGWQQLAELFRQLNDLPKAHYAEQKVKDIKAIEAPIVAASHLFYDGKIKQAEQQVRAYLKVRPKYVPGMRLLAQIAAKLYVLHDADTLLKHALALAPDDLDLRLEYVHILQKRQRFQTAIEVAQDGLQRFPQEPYLLLALASQYAGLSDFTRAMPIFDEALSALPEYALGFLQRGHHHKTLGNIDAAIADYQRAYQLKTDFGDAYWSLANLKTYQFSADEIAQMQALVAQPTLLDIDKYHIAFALGKAFEDLRDYDRAFNYYELGNRTKRGVLKYNPQTVTDEMLQQQQHCPPSLFSTLSKSTQADPIFIVGLPRAGSTLLEQILASHPLIEGTSELPYIISLSRQVKQQHGAYPKALDQLSQAELSELGERYLELAQAHRITDKPYFIDKMPNNFRHLGLIHKILPNAKIIDARRNPISCCFSGYKQLFAEGQEFSYGLEDIAQYYEDYVALMAHWQRCFGQNILQVDHDQVVADLDSQVTRMLDFIGVEFAPECLRFFETKRAIKTPSAEQVRQPINPNSDKQWQKFAAHLTPLLTRFKTHVPHS
jgi:tetratricopeptide (TPR) repeat protein